MNDHAYKQSKKNNSSYKLRCDFKPKDIDYLARLHGVLYSKEYGYDKTFETYVASDLTKFTQSFHPNKDRIWLAEIDNNIIGAIAIAGYSKVEARLRWFLVHPDYRRLGIGKELLKDALQFCKECKYKTIFLWTASELVGAGHLYTSFGFSRTEERKHEIWGKTVTEERYDLHL